MTDTPVRCDGCEALIIWRHHQRTGKRAPVNPTPDPSGNVVLVGDTEYRVLGKIERNGPPAMFGDEADRYTLHFATCPKADHFRRCGKCHKSPCRCPA